jgi:hypothetical protein
MLNTLRVAVVGLGVAALGSASVLASPIHVSPKADVYIAGGNVRPGTSGELPSLFAFSSSPGQTFTFDVTGSASPFGAGTLMLGADGNLGGIGGLPDIGKLSAVTYPGNSSLPLFAVFLGDALPAAPPPGLDFFTTGVAFASLAPALGQVFWIGDGLTGTGLGAAQVFYVPAGATRLFFGFIDDAGAYLDNVGGFDVTVNAQAPDPGPVPVPEPATLILLSSGLWLGARRRQRGSR